MLATYHIPLSTWIIFIEVTVVVLNVVAVVDLVGGCIGDCGCYRCSIRQSKRCSCLEY